MIVECPGCKLRHDVTGRPPGTRARCRCGTQFRLPEPPAEAGSLVCPGCGAPTASSNRSCEYCGAKLATARCPRCFSTLFRGTKHCGQCGAAVEVPARALSEQGRSERQCPRCSTPDRAAPMTAHLVAETLLDQCDDCGGIWLDQTAFERLSEASQQQRGALDAVGGLPRPRTPLGADAVKVTYLACPDCAALMTRRNFAKRSGVIIDVCNAHGIWFDDEELTKILEFVKAGGLEETRRRDLDDLREEERKLRLQAQREAARGALSGRADYFGENRAGGGLGLLDVARTLSRLF